MPLLAHTHANVQVEYNVLSYWKLMSINLECKIEVIICMGIPIITLLPFNEEFVNFLSYYTHIEACLLQNSLILSLLTQSELGQAKNICD